MMKLYIARHGEASFNAPSDAERPLTESGRQAISNMVENYSDSLKDVSQIWSSHLERAIQTASYFEAESGINAERKPFLTPDSQAETVIKKLSERQDESSLLLVSHQPLVGELFSMLVHGDRYQAYPFLPGEVLVLEMDVPAAGLATQVDHLKPY